MSNSIPHKSREKARCTDEGGVSLYALNTFTLHKTLGNTEYNHHGTVYSQRRAESDNIVTRQQPQYPTRWHTEIPPSFRAIIGSTEEHVCANKLHTSHISMAT